MIPPAYRNLVDRLKAANGLPSPFMPTAQRYKDANDCDGDGFLSDDEARETARFIRDAYRQASGEKPVDDDDDGVEAAVGKAFAKPVRTLLTALRRAR